MENEGTGAPLVSFVSSHARLGGSERYLEMLLARLDQAWIQSVICLEPGPFAERLTALGYRVSVIDTGRHAHDIIRSAWRLRRHYGEQRPSVVHANGIKAALVAVIATAVGGPPVVWVKHDFSHDGWLGNFVARRSAQIVAVSEAIVSQLGRRPRARVHVIPTGVALDDGGDLTASRAELELLVGTNASRVIALVGRLDPSKGHLELLEVAPALRERVPSLRIVFIGDEDPSFPDHRARIERRIHELDLDDAVTLAGYRADARALIAACDAIVIPTTPRSDGLGREGFGLVGLEAMAVGTSVVGYDEGALREVLGECALLVPSGDRTALTAAVARVLLDDDLRARLERCGKERVRANYPPARMIAAMEERYRTAATNVRPG